uniref:F-box domain-containing protein n=1 Tax=Aegilops tauschii subsp. strangulata TaxID=200361 RepID=A0A453MIQ2_AEGTS
MESPPLKLNVARDEDRISDLPDELLLRILARLDLRDAVRAGAASTRWRHLPHQLSVLLLGVSRFRRATLVESMDAFAAALLSVCPPAERSCECQRSHAIKALALCFYLSAPHLSSIGRALEDVVSRGKTKWIEFRISPPPGDNTAPELTEFGQQFMSFCRAYQVAFRWLTSLTLENLAFGDSDVTDLISNCVKLESLALRACRMVNFEHSVLKIDTPCSGLQELNLVHFVCKRIQLISVPKLRQASCLIWRFENPPVRLDYVPDLRHVAIACLRTHPKAPFKLSECLSRSALNLSELHLNFFHQMIWIQPEHPKQLTAIFRNLSNASLSGIFPECDLSWTLFILEAAPALQKFGLSRTRHACANAWDNNAEKTNVVWDPSKDLKHMNLKSLMIDGFEEEDKVAAYIWLVVER